MKRNKKGFVAALLLGITLASGVTYTASAYNESSFSEWFYISKTGYTSNQDKVSTGADGWVNCSSMSGSSSFTATMVNSDHKLRSDPKKISSTGYKAYVNTYESAIEGKWYYYKMVVPNLGTTLKGTFSVL